MKPSPTEWEVSKTDPTSYEDVDNLPLPQLRKSCGLLKLGLRPVPAKMADGFGKRTSLLSCGWDQVFVSVAHAHNAEN